MSFLNQSSQCNNGNDIYSSNLKEISGIGVLEFDDIFEDLDLQTFKKPQNRFEKNNSLYISSKKKPDAETLQLNQEKARTETIQNQSSFNNLNENYLSCNNVKRYASLYNKAGNLTKGPPIEEPILNPFQKKGNNLCQETNNPKLNVENNNTNNNLEKKVQSNNKSLIKCDEEKNNDKEPYFNNNPLKFEDNLNISNNFYPPQNFTDESQNIVNIIKHLSMADYPSQKAILKSEYGSPMFQNSHNYSINFAIIEDFQKAQIFFFIIT